MVGEKSKVGKDTKIYTVSFIWDSSFMSTRVNEILSELESKCKNVDFVGKDIVTNIVRNKEGAKLALKNIEDLRKDLDGVLAIGYPSSGFPSTGFPTIVVNDLFKTWILPSHRYPNTLLAYLSEYDISPSVSSSRLKDLVEKIKLIQAIKNLKNQRLLSVARDAAEPGEGFGGIKIIPIGVKELMEQIEKINEEEAKKIAKMWINEAKDMREPETDEAEVIKSAKQYSALENLIEKYDATAVTSRGCGFYRYGQEVLEPIDSMPGLAIMEFKKRLFVAVAQADMSAAIIEMLALYLTGRPGFTGDVVIDPFHDVVIVMHCCGPAINPYGDDRRIPYAISNHTGWKPGTGGAVPSALEFPVNETVTIIRINTDAKKMELFTGKTVDGYSLYKNWNDLACRNKLTLKVDDAKKLLKNWDPATFGIHRVAIYGDFREKFKELATLMGFEVIEL